MITHKLILTDNEYITLKMVLKDTVENALPTSTVEILGDILRKLEK